MASRKNDFLEDRLTLPGKTATKGKRSKKGNVDTRKKSGKNKQNEIAKGRRTQTIYQNEEAAAQFGANLFYQTFLGKALLGILAILLFLGINLVLSTNQLNAFLILLGVESIVFFILFFIYTYRKITLNKQEVINLNEGSDIENEDAAEE